MAWDFAALLILILRFAEFTSAIGIWGIAGFIFKDSAAFALFTFQDSVLLLDSHFRILYRCSVYISGFCAGFIFQDSAAFAGFTSQDSALLLDSHFRILQPCWIHISGVCSIAGFTSQDFAALLDSHFRSLLDSHFRILYCCSIHISGFCTVAGFTFQDSAAFALFTFQDSVPLLCKYFPFCIVTEFDAEVFNSFAEQPGHLGEGEFKSVERRHEPGGLLVHQPI